MITKCFAAAAGFNADQSYLLVLDEVMKNSDGVRSATDASDDRIRQAAFSFQNLCASFASDNFLEIADHGGIRMRAQHAAQQIVCGPDVGDPIAHGFVDRILQSARAGLDAA